MMPKYKPHQLSKIFQTKLKPRVNEKPENYRPIHSKNAADHSIESTVSVVQIQNDEMKGRSLARREETYVPLNRVLV